jgi:hypothetical protein
MPLTMPLSPTRRPATPFDPAALWTTLQQRVAAAIAKGEDAQDAAWNVVCRATNRLSLRKLAQLVAVAFPSDPLHEIERRYADADHESTGAIYQSALMAKLAPEMAA